MFSLDRSNHPSQRHHATLHGVVFDYFAWGCFRHFRRGRAPRPANEKSPALRQGLPCSRSVQVRTSDLAADWESGPDDSGPAAAGPVSGRRPAAGRASGPGSGSAGPGSGSGCSFGISVVERNGETTGKSGVGFGGTPVPPGSLRGVSLSQLRPRNPGYKKLALYKPFKPHSALLPHPVPAVRKRHDASSWAAGALAASRL